MLHYHSGTSISRCSSTKPGTEIIYVLWPAVMCSLSSSKAEGHLKTQNNLSKFPDAPWQNLWAQKQSLGCQMQAKPLSALFHWHCRKRQVKKIAISTSVTHFEEEMMQTSLCICRVGWVPAEHKHRGSFSLHSPAPMQSTPSGCCRVCPWSEAVGGCERVAAPAASSSGCPWPPASCSALLCPVLEP